MGILLLITEIFYHAPLYPVKGILSNITLNITGCINCNSYTFRIVVSNANIKCNCFFRSCNACFSDKV